MSQDVKDRCTMVRSNGLRHGQPRFSNGVTGSLLDSDGWDGLSCLVDNKMNRREFLKVTAVGMCSLCMGAAELSGCS